MTFPFHRYPEKVSTLPPAISLHCYWTETKGSPKLQLSSFLEEKSFAIVNSLHQLCSNNPLVIQQLSIVFVFLMKHIFICSIYMGLVGSAQCTLCTVQCVFASLYIYVVFLISFDFYIFSFCSIYVSSICIWYMYIEIYRNHNINLLFLLNLGGECLGICV